SSQAGPRSKRWSSACGAGRSCARRFPRRSSLAKRARSATASSMIVSDASLLVDFLIDGGERGAWATAEIAAARHICAPHLLDVEVLAALRKRVAAREPPA